MLLKLFKCYNRDLGRSCKVISKVYILKEVESEQLLTLLYE